MRRILSLCLLLALVWPCHAQQKPNTLTPKEIADGWILLFDGETTFGWKIDGKSAVDGGLLRLGGTMPAQATAALDFPNYKLEYEYRVEGKRAAGMMFSEHSLAFDTATADKEAWKTGWLKVDGLKGELPNGNSIDLPGAIRPNWATQAETILLLRNIKLRPLNTKPLFTGTDLAGWREFPGKKSKFAVIDNAINVKDGPGDLQTVGKYKDFILQLECKSNGKHLNSGIFFRCRDNEYQNGYECQIRNQFTEKPTQKYVIEDFDPMTHKLLGKNEILSTAVDYGTGAIYRRVPARKEMSKDGEWFGMTIVAHGNHLATWVNGVQVTNWYDNRPKADNARIGCKLEAGHISIQGHDPTTDLSFKNFRIAELK